MKKHFIAFYDAISNLGYGICTRSGIQDVPVKQDTKEISY